MLYKISRLRGCPTVYTYPEDWILIKEDVSTIVIVSVSPMKGRVCKMEC